LIENNAASGVAFYRTGSGKLETVRARREVVLSAGAVGSAQLLLLSGVGPRSDLEKVGVEVKKDMPGVGENLQDHLLSAETWESFEKFTIEASDVGIKNVIEWKLWKTGILTTGGIEVNGFIKTEPELKAPDIQLHFLSLLPTPDVEKQTWIDKGSTFGMFDRDHDDEVANFPSRGFGIASTLLHPASRGNIKLFSNNPFDYPFINTNYLSDPRDMKAIVEGLKFARRMIHGTNTFKGKVKRTISDYTIPYPLDSDEYLIERVKRSVATVYHPVGTCKMGPSNDPMAVVDPQLRVYGIARLRVVDASVMPTLTSGNTHVPTIMIAEKAADIIKQQYASAAL